MSSRRGTVDRTTPAPVPRPTKALRTGEDATPPHLVEQVRAPSAARLDPRNDVIWPMTAPLGAVPGHPYPPHAFSSEALTGAQTVRHLGGFKNVDENEMFAARTLQALFRSSPEV